MLIHANLSKKKTCKLFTLTHLSEKKGKREGEQDIVCLTFAIMKMSREKHIFRVSVDLATSQYKI